MQPSPIRSRAKDPDEYLAITLRMTVRERDQLRRLARSMNRSITNLLMTLGHEAVAKHERETSETA